MRLYKMHIFPFYSIINILQFISMVNIVRKIVNFILRNLTLNIQILAIILTSNVTTSTIDDF